MELNDNQIFLYKEFPEKKKFLSEYAITSNELSYDDNVSLGRIKGKNIDDLVEGFLGKTSSDNIEILFNPKYSGDFVTDGTGSKPFLYNERGVSKKVAEKFASSFSRHDVKVSVQEHSVSLRYFCAK